VSKGGIDLVPSSLRVASVAHMLAGSWQWLQPAKLEYNKMTTRYFTKTEND